MSAALVTIVTLSAPSVARAETQRTPDSLVEKQLSWDDDIQDAKHAINDFGRAAFGDRFAVATRNEFNEIVVRLIRATADDQVTLSAYADSIREGYGQYVRVENAAFSETIMNAIDTRIFEEVIKGHEGPTGWSLGIDRVSEVIEVEGPADSIQSFRAEFPNDIGMPVVYRETAAFVPHSCTVNATAPGKNRCDRPIRGGVWIEGCTTGFVVRSDSDNLPYILTAGHCVTEPIVHQPRKNALYSTGASHPIGYGHNSSYFWTSTPKYGDAGIVRIEFSAPSAGQWGTLRAWVFVKGGSPAGPGGAPNPVTDEDYYINSKATALNTIGDRVCITGQHTGSTRCGRVDDIGRYADYEELGMPFDGHDYHPIIGLTLTNLCASGGDSGAPIFSGHKAYGIHSGGSSACSSVYYPIQFAESDLNVHVALGT